MNEPPQSLNGRSETGRVGMTGPLIHARAGRTPLPLMHPRQLSGLPLLPPLSADSPYTQYSILNTLVSSGPPSL